MKIVSSISDSNITDIQSSLINPLSDYTATVAWVSVPNWSMILPLVGKYRIVASSSVQIEDTNADANVELYVRLAVNNIAIVGTMRKVSHDINGGSLTLPIEITYTESFATNQVVTLQAYTPNAGDTCIVGGQAGSLGAVPTFSYELLTTYVPANSIPVTNWETFDMIVKGTVADPTKHATPAQDIACWRRVGNNMEITWTYVHSTVSATGSGTYIFQIPNGHNIDFNYLGWGAITSYRGVCGVCSAEAAVLGVAIGLVFAYEFGGAGDGLLLYVDTTGSGRFFINQGGYGFSTAPLTITFQAKVPILGW